MSLASFPGNSATPKTKFLVQKNYIIASFIFLSHLAPSVTAAIAVSSATVIGGRVTLTCDVTGLSSLASDTTITFSGPRTRMGTGSTSLQLLLDPALLSDAGQYTCMASVTSSFLDSAVEDTETEDLRLQSELIVAIIDALKQKMFTVRKEYIIVLCSFRFIPGV